MPGAATWDERFRSGSHASSDPDPFFHTLRPSLSLTPRAVFAADIACGAGRHAAALAALGMRVHAVDNSAEALALTKRRCSGLPVETLQVDLEAAGCGFGEAVYDVIAAFFFLHRPLFAALDAALRPGGLLLYKTYTTDRKRFSGGPRHPDHLLEPNELLRVFARYRVLRYEEEADGRGTAALLAQKPL